MKTKKKISMLIIAIVIAIIAISSLRDGLTRLRRSDFVLEIKRRVQVQYCTKTPALCAMFAFWFCYRSRFDNPYFHDKILKIRNQEPMIFYTYILTYYILFV